MSPEAEATELEQRRSLPDLKARIASAQSVEELLSGHLAERIAELIGGDRATLFANDTKTAQLHSIAKSDAGPVEIRVDRGPSSVVGFVASLKKPVPINLKDVYDEAERAKIHPKLFFDKRWDEKTGYRTRQLLTVPVLHSGALLGALQLLNKKDGTGFGPRDVALAEEVAVSIGSAFYNQNRMRSLKEGRKPTRWDWLVDKGRISLDDLNKAVADAAALKPPVDPARHLIEKIGIDRADVEKSLAVYFNCEAYKFTGLETIPEEFRKVKFESVRQSVAAPLERQAGALLVVIDDPSDIARTDQVRRMHPETRVTFEVGLRDEILACIDRSYGRGEQGQSIKDLASQAFTVEDDAEEESGTAAAEDSTLIKLVNQVIIDAYRKGASDIHIEPNGKERAVVVRFRVDGDCIAYNEFPAQLRAPMVSRLKIMALLDISERRKPQDGKIRFQMPDRVIELRVATIPTVNSNEDVVMRILAASKPIPLDDMGMSKRNLRELRKLITKPYGLILCVGPTGSGKTTTLHSALGAVNTVDMKIWTAEDPVEITQAGLRQVQVNSKIGFTFAAAMRSFLRADPDVIMVGEMRDQETAATGIEASLTGHLVFSTLHTNSAPETVTRLIEMGLDPFSFADALLGVLAQRLARKLCSKCKKQVPATPEELQIILNAFTPEEMEARGWKKEGFQLWAAPGCGSCGDSGYKGRVGVHELLVTDDELKRAITQKGAVETIRNLAIKGGMATLLQDGIEKAVAGGTDLKQVLAVCAR